MPSNNSIVEIDGLQKEYGSFTAVENVSITIDRGEIVGILGPNGAGKTTVIKSMLGLIEPTAGRVEINGVDVGRSPRAAYDAVGAMLEGARNIYWRLTVRENLDFFSRLVGNNPADERDRHDELLSRFGLLDKADEQVNQLSRGQKQKTAIACTLARDVDVFVLDEPTLGLDVESSRQLQRELARLAAEESFTVLLSSHDMDVIETLCERVIVLQDGSIIADEAVEDLVGVFRTQTYRIAYDGDLPTSIIDAPHVSVEAHGDVFVLEMTLEDVAGLLDLLDRLATRGTIRSLESIDADLEDAFIGLTSETNHRHRCDAVIPGDAT